MMLIFSPLLKLRGIPNRAYCGVLFTSISLDYRASVDMSRGFEKISKNIFQKHQNFYLA
uniref:Uncharacterized protein n=1 Tax=Bacteriophage sp. TaxID=38018 RepID=A0A7G9A4N3_9VIRU|nr:MAG: hypothetical protein [Bacteriophage sp.]